MILFGRKTNAADLLT